MYRVAWYYVWLTPLGMFRLWLMVVMFSEYFSSLVRVCEQYLLRGVLYFYGLSAMDGSRKCVGVVTAAALLIF